MHILFVASEAVPFIKTGGLADVIGTLPKELTKKGVNVSIMIPYYRNIKDKYHFNSIKNFIIEINGKPQYCGICKTVYENITYYFIDNNYFFYRDGSIYNHFDDGERFAYFNLAVVESLKKLDFFPNLLHLNDWQTGVIPYLLKKRGETESAFNKIRTLFTIHNIEHQGQFPSSLSQYLNSDFTPSLEYHNMINFMKTGIIEADYVSTVSETYANEIKTAFYGFGLQDIINTRIKRLKGIINGIDYMIFNPSTDKHIYFNYSVNQLADKKKNKTALKKEFDFPRRKAPLIGLVSRLVDQKGIDLIIGCVKEVINKTDAMFVFMGSGSRQYTNQLNILTNQYPYNIKVYIGYNEKIAQKIYAASDMFLMPSKYEPCGLSQMIALRYGSLPIVRETGGLKDTVKPYNKYSKEGWGFSFINYDRIELSNCLIDAINFYNSDRNLWNDLVRRAMLLDYSWESSATKYIELYKKLLKGE